MDKLQLLEKEYREKTINFLLPNFFTAGNLLCGYLSILLSFKNSFYAASLALVAAGILDSLDGRLARILRSQSSFGEQFDSLADLVSFALAPSFLLYHYQLHEFNRLGIACCFLFALCGALRLARFNANINKVDSAYFQGLPSPAAAMCLVGHVLVWSYFFTSTPIAMLTLVYVVIIGLLMISTVQFPSFKKSSWIEKNKRKTLLILLLLTLSILVKEELMIYVIMQSYLLFGLCYYFYRHQFKFFGLIDESDE